MIILNVIKFSQKMGAGGDITILDADVVAQHGYDPSEDFRSAQERTIFGRRIWTIYFSTEYGFDAEYPTARHTLNDYEEIGAVLDTWQVWT